MKPAWARPEHTIALSLLALSSSNVSKCRRGFALVVVLVVTALIIGFGATLGYQKLKTKPSPSPTPAIDQTKKDLSSDLSPKASAAGETSVKEESANWETYKNTEVKFSVKYPQSLALENRSDTFAPFAILLIDKSKEVPYHGAGKINPNMSITARPTSKSLADFVNDVSNNLILIENKTIGENQFLIVREKMGISGPVDQYAVKHLDKIIFIANSRFPIEDKLFNQILSTFQFIN